MRYAAEGLAISSLLLFDVLDARPPRDLPMERGHDVT